MSYRRKYHDDGDYYDDDAKDGYPEFDTGYFVDERDLRWRDDMERIHLCDDAVLVCLCFKMSSDSPLIGSELYLFAVGLLCPLSRICSQI